ncbi:hypothetical protein QR680_014498 [Steinernema hermaphroditum]|uniref:Uncharacterized protein n=1 Tax=Steinernema hermaphroditum TaxID=289476 RepID=A0AA39I920_9BILA|nr:hypothetical protein QR680_014498 [Steinernema hermaphroditum]
MKCAFVVLALFAAVGYGCNPIVNDPSMKPGPPVTEKPKITPPPKDKELTDEEKLQKLNEKITKIAGNLKTVEDEIMSKSELLTKGNSEYDGAKKGNNVKIIDNDIRERTTADKLRADLKVAETKVEKAQKAFDQAKMTHDAAKKLNDAETDQAKKAQGEAALTELLEKQQTADEQLLFAITERDIQITQIPPVRAGLPSLEELQNEKKEAEKKNKETIDSFEKLAAELQALGIQKQKLENEIALLRKETAVLEANKKE